MKPKCEDCRFWDDLRGKTGHKPETFKEYYPHSLGVCRRNPPDVKYGWNKTEGHDWCGEFQAQSEKNEKEVENFTCSECGREFPVVPGQGIGCKQLSPLELLCPECE